MKNFFKKIADFFSCKKHKSSLVYSLTPKAKEDFLDFIKTCKDPYSRYEVKLTYREIQNIGHAIDENGGNTRLAIEYLEWEGWSYGTKEKDKENAVLKLICF